MKIIAYIGLGVLGGLILGYGYFHSRVGTFGATTARTTITNPWTMASTTKLGSSGNEIKRFNFGVCNIQASGNTIAASSTKTVDCSAGTGAPPGTALTGVTAGDRVIVMQPTTTPSTIMGLHINGCSASSTAGYLTCVISNQTGTTFTWTSAASSSWQYYAFQTP